MRSSLLALVALSVSVHAGCRGCPEKNRVCPDPTKDECGECKIGFSPVPLDKEGIMPCYADEEECNDVTTCNNNGRCSSYDNKCQCFPGYFGPGCEKIIETGGISNSGLVGVVVGWLIGFCVMVFFGKKLYQMYEEDKLDHLKCLCCSESQPRARGRFERANNREPANRRDRDGPAVEFVEANQRGGNQAPAQAATARDYGRLALDRPATTPATQPAQTAVPSQPSGPSLEEKMKMVKQIKEIIPNTTNEKALSALQSHQWNLANAIQFLMEESLAQQA